VRLPGKLANDDTQIGLHIKIAAFVWLGSARAIEIDLGPKQQSQRFKLKLAGFNLLLSNCT